jgi:Protein of unknown function (DUF2752)
VRLVLVAAAAVGLPTAATVLHLFPPEQTAGLYPPCFFYLLTGLHCPGCGATRCVDALVHGDLPQALAYNPLLILALPLIAVGVLHMVYGLWTGRRLGVLKVPLWLVYALPWVLVAFWVLRNIDVYPLTLLAPHKL